MALAVAGISVAVGVLALAKVLLPAVDDWADHRGLLVGSAVMAGVLLAFVGGMVAAARQRAINRAPSGAE
jgi:hypothetical protein